MLRVKGVILSPTNDTLPYTSLVFETITGSTEVLPRTTGLIELGEDGSYDFPLLLGAYKVYANYANSMRMDLLGTCSVSQGMKPEMTLNELVSNYTYYPTTPDWVTDLDSKWQGYFQDLFNRLINDINTNVTNLNMAIVDGDARVVFDMTTYTNDVTGQLGATLIQQIKAGDSEILNQSIAYSDRWGNELATNVLTVSNSISTVSQELTAWKKESGDAYAGIVQRIELNEAQLGSEIAAEVNAQTGMMELRINEYMQYQDAELRSYMNATIDQVTGDMLLQIGDQITNTNAALKSEMQLYVDTVNATQTASITNQISVGDTAVRNELKVYVDSENATQIASITDQINAGDATVKNELKVYVDSENATQTASITNQINTANGAIQQQISVVEGKVDTTTTNLNTTIGTMQQINSNLDATNGTVSNIQNSLATTQAAWQVVATVGQLTSAIGMVNDGINSTVYVQANQFVITDDNKNITASYAPFVIVNGKVYIKEAAIGELHNKTFVQRANGYMSVLGIGFGINNEFIEWYGPDVGDISNCSKVTAITYKTNMGDAYYGGSLSAGILRNAVTTSVKSLYTVGDYPVTIGAFGTNGRTKVVIVSYALTATSMSASKPNNPLQPQLSWKLQRKIGSGAWADISSGVFNGSTTAFYESEAPAHWVVNEDCNGSYTYVDTTTSTDDYSYRVLVVSHSRYHVSSNVSQQLLTLVSTEG